MVKSAAQSFKVLCYIGKNQGCGKQKTEIFFG